MKIVFIFFLSLVWSLPHIAQENFDVELLCSDLFDEVNQLRISKNFKPFIKDEILDAVAFDQAEYILKTGNLIHTQTNSKKEKLTDRVLFYEGLFSQAGENIAQVGLNSKVVLELGQSKKIADSPDKMLLGALNSWLVEEEGKLNLLDPNFLLCGISVIENDKKELIVVLVMASEPFDAPDGVKLNYNNYGIKSYKKEACDAFLAEHGSLSQLFSDGFMLENGHLKFQFNSLAFWNELIENGKDGLAVELIARDQFDCDKTNRLFPGGIANGLLLKPFYKSKLPGLNASEAENKVDFNLGELPGFYNETDYEINGMILKDGNKCVSIPFNKVKTENVRWLEIPFQNSNANLDSTFTGADTTQINFSYDSIDFVFADLQVLLSGLQFQLENIEIKIHVSPSSKITEEDVSIKVNEALMQYFSPSIAINYSIEVDWVGFKKFKQGTFYQLETTDFTQEQELAYLEETKKTDTGLKLALRKLSRIELKISGTYDIKKELSYENRMRLLNVLIQKDKIDLALHFQNELLKEAINSGKELELLVTGDQQQLKQTLPLINNQIIAQHTLGERRFDGNPIHTAFLELYLIDGKDPILANNYHLALLSHWSESVNNISEIEKWKKGFEKLKSSSFISQEAYSITYLNYLIIAADYYYEKSNFEKRKKAFDEMLRYAQISNLSDDNVLSVVKYLCHQDQYPRAIKMLLPEVKKEKVSEEVLFYFLQIAIYDENQVSEKLYFSMLEKSKILFPDSFCNLFSNKKMGMQQLINPRIKELYCNHCNQ